MSKPEKLQRMPAEHKFREELERLAAEDTHAVPPGWRMSPIAVEQFILGDPDRGIRRKFVSEPGLVRRMIISLCTNRGSLLIGEPGTAKSWLSELVCAAISADSSLTIQGGSVSEINQLLYGWNDAIRNEKGPVPEALVPAPFYRAMAEGKLVRFEEISRCPQSLQDAILAIISDRIIVIPEIEGEAGVVVAREGFNVIATSNSVDEGVFKMSAALKRRLNYETIQPIRRVKDEIDVVMHELEGLNARSGVETPPDPAVIEVLVTIFHELRSGQSLDGRSTHRLASASMSTAEAVNVAHAMSVHAWYYEGGAMKPEHLVHFLVGSALKDEPEDRARLRQYFDTELARRDGEHWQQVYAHRHLI